MEETAYVTSIVAGTFYLVAGFRLMRLSRRTGERPELLLGFYFAFSGQWYVLYNLPYFFGQEALPPLIEQVVEWLYVVGVVPYLLFIQTVFRPGSAPATAVVVASALLLVAGSAASSLSGGFSNLITDPAYLIEWAGYTVPCLWMCGEGALSHAAANRRVRIGLCDPIVANRYLLFAGFGLFQTAACAADLLWALGNSAQSAASTVGTGLLAGTEIASVAVLSLAFFPPLPYTRWITRRAAIDSAPVGG